MSGTFFQWNDLNFRRQVIKDVAQMNKQILKDIIEQLFAVSKQLFNNKNNPTWFGKLVHGNMNWWCYPGKRFCKERYLMPIFGQEVLMEEDHDLQVSFTVTEKV